MTMSPAAESGPGLGVHRQEKLAIHRAVRTSGAVNCWWRRPATKVVVFQWPCGAEAISAAPSGASVVPVILVDMQVSSIKTSFRCPPGLSFTRCAPRRLHVRALLLAGVQGFF